MLIPEKVSSEFSEWLSPKDLALCIALAREISSSPNLLEIGVWKGGWAVGVLRGIENAHVVGIDPYPGEAYPVREEALSTIESQGLASRFNLIDSHQNLIESGLPSMFDLVHIDGHHTEKSVLRDAVFAHEALTPNGVIVFDDHLHPAFPGIRSALYRFLNEFDYRPFLSTEGKLYVAKAQEAREWYQVLRGALEDSKLIASQLYLDEKVVHPSNVQETDVLGQPVLLALGWHGISTTASLLESPSWGAIWKDLLPPFVHRRLFRKAE